MRQSFEVRGGPLEGETFGLDVERHEEVEFAVDRVTHFYRAQWTEYPSGDRYYVRLHYIGRGA